MNFQTVACDLVPAIKGHTLLWVCLWFAKQLAIKKMFCLFEKFDKHSFFVADACLLSQSLVCTCSHLVNETITTGYFSLEFPTLTLPSLGWPLQWGLVSHREGAQKDGCWLCCAFAFYELVSCLIWVQITFVSCRTLTNSIYSSCFVDKKGKLASIWSNAETVKKSKMASEWQTALLVWRVSLAVFCNSEWCICASQSTWEDFSGNDKGFKLVSSYVWKYGRLVSLAKGTLVQIYSISVCSLPSFSFLQSIHAKNFLFVSSPLNTNGHVDVFCLLETEISNNRLALQARVLDRSLDLNFL